MDALQTVVMPMFGSRTGWDLKMSAVVPSAVLLVVRFTSSTVGITGRALHPDPSAFANGSKDSIYPLLLDTPAAPWIQGVIVAGIVAAFDSIGSTLSAHLLGVLVIAIAVVLSFVVLWRAEVIR